MFASPSWCVSWSSHVVVPSAPCPHQVITACCCRHAPSLPRHPALSLHLAVWSLSCHVLVVLVACLHHVLGSPQLDVACVSSSLSCVSAKWVGMNVGWGVLTVVSEIKSNDER